MKGGKGLIIVTLGETVNEMFGDGKSQERGKNLKTHIMEILLHTLVQLWKALLCVVDDVVKRLEKQRGVFLQVVPDTTSSLRNP